ncbi:MAG TPA: hypothetical protein VEU96_04320 [Bryobacteraceae bacterium]|nr:hypothetical protein [Bryobacteraceae bacterium]
MTFTVTNPSGSPITAVAFTDTFPANLFVQNPNNLTGSCGAGTITAIPGSSAVSLSGGTIPASGSCMFSVNVLVQHQTTDNATPYTNTTGNVSASSGTGNTATDTLTVGGNSFSIAKGFSPNAINQGSNSTLIFTLTQANFATPGGSADIEFSDPLPPGVVVATPNGLDPGTCGPTNAMLVINATAGSSSITVGDFPDRNTGGDGTGINLAPAGTPGDTCQFSVSVTGITSGTKVNTTSNGIQGVNLTNSSGNPGTATLNVIVVATPPTIAKAFNPTTVSIGQTSTLTFTVTNPGSNPLTGVGFTDTLPANLFIQTPNGLTGSCGGGTITATAGTGTVSLSGATIAASSSCSFSVSVVAFVGTPAGQIYTNTTGNVTSNEAGPGNTATATLTVTAMSAQFVIGDTNAIVGDTVTFWGAQWAKDNTLSGGPAPNAFKGFTDTVPASCGGDWISRPGNSSQPPDTVPLFMAVIASSTITKSGAAITGDIPKIVVVRTNPGYGPSPGHTGTGTVVAVVCP